MLRQKKRLKEKEKVAGKLDGDSTTTTNRLFTNDKINENRKLNKELTTNFDNPRCRCSGIEAHGSM